MKRTATAAALGCLLALTGCGGGSHHKAAPHASPKPATAHALIPARCSSQNESMSCVLHSLPAPGSAALKVQPALAFSPLQGIDFAWTKFSPQSAGSFGASYLSSDPSKNWNPTLIREYHAAGRGTVAVFEEGGTQAADGCARGAADARFSEGLLTSWGYPHSHFDMAIDFDASGSQVYDYFRCANAAEPGLVGAYGGYFPLQYLCSKGVIHESWQTYAWSRGLWLPASCAPLEQYLNGSTFDHDRAIASNYGQFPGPSTGPSQKTIRHWRTARNSSFTVYHSRHCSKGLTKDKAACPKFAQRVVYFQGKLWTVYHKWSCWGKHARTKTLVCWIARPTASIWSKRRDSTRRAYQLNGCAGPVNFPVPRRSPFCNRLSQRERWFAAKVKWIRRFA